MTKVLHKNNFPSEFKTQVKKNETQERSWALSSILLEVNTTGLASSEIDTIVVGGGSGAPPNGKMISDPTNKLLLIRQENVWRKVAVT